MKKYFAIIAFCLLTASVSHVFAQASEVTIKKGKAVLDEAYYYQLKQDANTARNLEAQVEELQNKLDKANAELKKRENKPLLSFNDSASYAIARDIANAWQQQQLGINTEVVAQSFWDLSHGVNNWSRETMQPLLQRFQTQFEQREKQKREQMMGSLDKNKEDGAKFLAENAKSKSVYTTKSGLQYRILKSGNGKHPNANSIVKLHYTGTLIDGKKFDSSVDRGEPIESPVGRFIPGWVEGLQLMDEGSKYILYIPYNLGYGENPAGEIPPGSTLIFEVELLEILN